MRSFKALLAAGGLVVTALVGGTLISAALAAPSATGQTPTTTTADETDTSTYCQTFLDAFAKELGTTNDKVTAAAKAAADAAIDAAVAAGDLTADQATAMKDRVANATGDGCGLLGRFGFGRGGPGGPGKGLRIGMDDLVSAAATALDLTPAELTAKLRSGDSLKEVADAKGVDYATVSAAVTGALDTALKAAVTAGDLTQAQADEIKTHIASEITDGTWPDHIGRGGRFGGPHHAPDASASPSAGASSS